MIRIVLVETTHPGNIGAAARAMKNMGLEDLALVRPHSFPHADATARASAAADLLERARVFDSLDGAIADCGLVIGSTARERVQHFEILDARAAAAHVVAVAQTRPAAIVFGSERIGLTNDDLSRCHSLLRIPASATYPSLNLGMAVQIVCYELLLAAGGAAALGERPVAFASAQELQRFYWHLGEVLDEIGFTDRTESGVHLMNRLRRLFNRAQLDENEVNILRGILTAVQGRRRRAGSSRD
jgi:TrmH family RNA methyltransferase